MSLTARAPTARTVAGILSRSQLDEVLALGVQAVERHYEGVPYGWRDANTPKLADIAAKWEVSNSTIYRCVAVASMWLECGRPAIENLRMSHLRELFSLEVEVQTSLIQRANTERWSVSRIREEKADFERRGDIRQGRPAGTTESHIQRTVALWLSHDDRLGEMHRLAKLTREEREELLKKVQALQMDFEMIRYRLIAKHQSAK